MEHTAPCSTRLLACLLLPIVPQAAAAASVFTARPDDPAAIHVDVPASRPADADHTALLQAALDRAAASPAGGIVLVPSGRYRVTRTLIVWRAVRVIGYGATRPVFVLPERTPGFQTGLGVMMHFTNARPRRRPGGAGGPAVRATRRAWPSRRPASCRPTSTIPDANQTTFYSSMMNVDFEIGDGNPAAVAVRFHVAQHGILSDIDFRIGSGLAGIIEVGNVGQRLRFDGGRYGIMATSTSPFWPYTLIDSVFEGQREAAIREHQTGLTVVRTTFRNVPVGISIDKGYSDNLWLKDARFESVATAAIVFDQPQNALTQIGAEGVVCVDTPVVRARARERPAAVRADAVARLPRPALQPRPVRPRQRQHRPHRSAVRRRAAGGGTGAAAAGAARAAADGAVGQRAHARRQGRRQDRRHQGAAGRRRRHARALFPVRHLRRPRHDHAEARHGADRAASRARRGSIWPIASRRSPASASRRRCCWRRRAAGRSSAASASSRARPTRAPPPCCGWPAATRS